MIQISIKNWSKTRVSGLDFFSSVVQKWGAAGTYAMTVGHLSRAVAWWGEGAKPPEAFGISHFLRPENGLGSYSFLSLLQYKNIRSTHLFRHLHRISSASLENVSQPNRRIDAFQK